MRKYLSIIIMALFALLSDMVLGQGPGHDGAAAYITTTTEPWGDYQNSNIIALDAVYGSTGWNKYIYGTDANANVSNIFSNSRTLVFIEGGNNNTTAMKNFLDANWATIETWISGGRILVVNAATNESIGEFQIGTSGVYSNRILTNSMIAYSNASTYPNTTSNVHPLLRTNVTIDGVTGDAFYSGDYYGTFVAHNVIYEKSGSSLNSIFTVRGQTTQYTLAEKKIGSGRMLVGGLTLPFFISSSSWSPQPQMKRLMYAMLGWVQVATNPAPTINTTAYSNLGMTSVTSGGNAIDAKGETITAKGVAYSTSQNPTTSNSTVSGGSGPDDFTVTLTGLTSNTTYYARAYATSPTGTGYGLQISFTTNGVAPTVTTQAVSSITTTSAICNGNITSLGAPNPTAYGICWNTTGTPTTDDSKVDKGAASSTGAFTASMTGLTANTTYYVRAFATNSAGTSYGTEVSFTTSPITSLAGSAGGTSIAQNAPVYIASGANVIGATLKGALVFINDNFNSVQDVLGIEGVRSGTSNSISWSYDSIKGILTLSGNADAATYQTILRKVTYTNTSSAPSASPRSITISLNKALPFSGTGHFYEFVPSSGITWKNAKAAAEARDFFGLKGYLATITSAEENAFCTSKLSGNVWMGATDEAVEGTWKWGTGPEAGTNLTYFNWAASQPDNFRGVEDYVQFYFDGKWNDLPDNATGVEPIAGYMVEYGGSADDPTLDISDVVTVDFTVPVTTDATNLQSNSFAANWNTVSGATNYYLDVATNSNFTALVSGYNNKDVGNVTTYTVEGLNAVTTYYYRVRATTSGYNSNVTSATTKKEDQTITFYSLPEKTYGDSDFAPAATASSGLTVTYTSSNTNVATIVGGIIHIVGAGTCTIYADQSGNGTYNVAAQASQQLTVTQRAITVTADDKTKIYGVEDPLPFTYSVTSGSLAAGDAFAGVLQRAAGEAIGSYAINKGTLTIVHGDTNKEANYAITYVPAEFPITPRTITVTADDKTKVYGDADPALTYQITDGSLAYIDAFTGALSRDAGEDVDTYAITQGSLALSSNYNLSFVPGELDITRRAITVTADDKTKVYGDVDPALTYQITAGTLAYTDTFTGALTRDAGEDVGTYAITKGSLTISDLVSGGRDNNYHFSFQEGALTLMKAHATIQLLDLEQAYTGKPLEVSYQTSPAGLQVNFKYDDISMLPSELGEYVVTAVIADKNHEGSATGIFRILEDEDGDGIPDLYDTDADNDGVPDDEDKFPDDPNEWADFDGDGIGDNADTDDDNDGVDDVDDAFPNDPSEWDDTDGDGIGNHADLDDDGDSVSDENDAFPLDSNEWADFDGDGIGDNADPDDDNDSTPDVDDAFAFDPNEDTDSDGDSVGDNSDLFPMDPEQSDDTISPVLNISQLTPLILVCGSDFEEQLQAWLDTQAGLVATDNHQLGAWSHDLDVETLLTEQCDGSKIIPVEFTVTDYSGNSSSFTATLIVMVNAAPEVITPLKDVEMAVNATHRIFASPMPGEIFGDDQNQALEIRYYAMGSEILPSWASVVNDTLVFSPAIADTGCYHLVVEARDIWQASVTDIFQVCIRATLVHADPLTSNGYGIIVYPNPASDFVRINPGKQPETPVEVTLMNLSGQAVLHRQFWSDQPLEIDLEGHKPGMYIIRIAFNNQTTYNKLMIERR